MNNGTELPGMTVSGGRAKVFVQVRDSSELIKILEFPDKVAISRGKAVSNLIAGFAEFLMLRLSPIWKVIANIWLLGTFRCGSLSTFLLWPKIC
jgi:hypothetical protein